MELRNKKGYYEIQLEFNLSSDLKHDDLVADHVVDHLGLRGKDLGWKNLFGRVTIESSLH